ncbi:MAG: BrnT family toxin [Chloroflexi bacterium]|nr:BrnT family toxin [Chloroflexota bacterium]MBU1660769.1 BrnT family toxin [Chloroflexota bacterium]
MYIDNFTWLLDVIDKIAAKHHVTQNEAEDIFFNSHRYHFVEKGLRTNEDVYSVTGQTNAGRYLIVFFIRKRNNIALIISARDMDKKERRRHERK